MDSGIYILRSLTQPRKIYVGGTRNLHERKNEHHRLLLNGISNHRKLQSHVNQYGINDLYFYIIEKCPLRFLKNREEFWILKLMPELNTTHIYNQTSILNSEARKKALKDMAKSNYKITLFAHEKDIKQLCKIGHSISGN